VAYKVLVFSLRRSYISSFLYYCRIIIVLLSLCVLFLVEVLFSFVSIS